MSSLTAAPPAGFADAAPRPSRWPRLWRGPETDARWVRPALLGLLLATGLLYVVGLSASGYGNAFYAAAVEAATRSWKALLFGSFDSSNFITVDKPPASLWVMDVFGRLFGFNSWSLLVPQALEGVATVGVLFATVRRRFSPGAALLAGAVMALTPVAALMFRFDNPDSLLVLLLTVAAYAVIRSLETSRTRAGTRWMVVAGVAIGLAFLTKTLQAFLVVPAMALIVLFLADVPWRRRLFQLGAGALGLVVSAGWWLATVTLWPASSRPYIGGSQNNSEWNLIFGYNGFGRLTGNESGSVGGRPTTGGGGMWGATGITRLLGADMGSQISWLLPAALLLAVGLLIWWRRAPRVNLARAQLLLWLGWLVVTALTFSFAQGIIHPYYTVALAPPIAALVGIGAAEVWRHRWQPGAQGLMVRGLGAVVILLTASWSWVLLDRSPDWEPWLRPLVLVTGVVAAIGLLALPRLRHKLAGGLVAAAAVAATLIGPAAYAVDTATTPHTGSIPSAGPTVTRADLFSGSNSGGPGQGGFGRFGGHTFRAGAGGGAPGGVGGTGGFPTPFGAGGFPTGQLPATGQSPTAGRGGRQGVPGAPGGAAGGLLQAGTVSDQLARLLRSDASSYTSKGGWVAAAIGANNAAGFQLATGEPVMAIGGFNGTDPAPSLAWFKAQVAAGKVHYFIGGGGFGGGGFGTRGGFGAAGGTGGRAGSSGSDSSAISSWVESHFKPTTVDGTTVYDLTQPTSSTGG